MKKIITLSALLVSLLSIQAQKNSTDSVPKKVRKDTLELGGVTIIINNKENDKAKTVKIEDKEKEKTRKVYRKKKANVSTSFLSVDWGFNNFDDNTNYASVGSFLQTAGTQTKPGANDFKLKNGKSVGVSIWLVSKKANIIPGKEHLGLKFAFGLEHAKYRFNSALTLKNATPSYAVKDSISFSKNQLSIGYLTVPLMLYVNPDGKNKFSFSAGASAGYRIYSSTKQKSGVRGKDKNNGEFDLNPFKLAVIGDIGYKYFHLFGSYGLTNLFDDATKMNITPFTIGFRISDW